MTKLAWFKMYEINKLNEWKDGDSIYFRFKPYLIDFLILILASALNLINKLFYDVEKTNEYSKKKEKFS